VDQAQNAAEMELQRNMVKGEPSHKQTAEQSEPLTPQTQVEHDPPYEAPREAETSPAIRMDALDVDRVGVVWRNLPWILLIAVAAAAATFVVSSVVPKTYSASATVSITLPPSESATASGQGVTAVGDLASQYASLATIGPVVARASRESGIPGSTLSKSVSAGTISGENLISVRGEARTASGSTLRANSIAGSLAHYVNASSAAQATSYTQSVAAKLKPLDKQVSKLTQEVSNKSLSVTARSVLQSSLGTLLVQRGELESVTVENTSSQPTAEFLAPATGSSIIDPKRSLYTAVAFVVMLLIAGQLSVSIAQYRRRPAA
jgi:capsular polysaccharide biosynthesis protein